MNTTDHQPLKHFCFQFNIYKAQRRPSFPHAFVNRGNKGIAIIELEAGKILAEEIFSRNYDSSGIINAWCLKSDGNSLMVFNDDTYTASLLSFDKQHAPLDIKPPPFKTFWDLRYDWDEDGCLLTGGRLAGIYKLHGNGFDELSGKETARANLNWLRVINKLPVNDCNVLKVETEKRQMIYLNYSVSPSILGVVSWADSNSWFVKAPEEVLEAAVHNESLFVLYENKIDKIDRQGNVSEICKPPDGFHFINLDTLPAYDGNKGSLIAVSNSWSGVMESCISVYDL